MSLKKRIISRLVVSRGRVVNGAALESPPGAGDPVALAARCEADGADEIVLLDISEDRDDLDLLAEIVRKTAQELSIPLCVGGGLGNLADIRTVMRAGADRVLLGGAAVSDPEFLRAAAAEFGAPCIVLAIDAGRNASGEHRAFVHDRTEETTLDPLKWAQRAAELGAGEVLLTVMDAGGMRPGDDLELARAVVDAVSIPVIIPCAPGTLAHLVNLFRHTDAAGALLNAPLHDGLLTIAQLKESMHREGIAVRLGG